MHRPSTKWHPGILGAVFVVLLVAGPAPPVSAQPDLEVSNVDTSGVTGDWQALTIAGNVSADVTNSGDADASGVFTITFFEDTDNSGDFDAGTDNVLVSTTTADLAAGASVTVTAAVAGSVLFRENLIYAFADSGDVIAESAEDNNLSNSGVDCEFEPPVGSFDPVLEWSWSSSMVFSGWLNVMMTPSVIDLTGDGIPDVVFGATASTGGGLVEVGVLRALSGDDGSEIFTVVDGALRVNTASSVATGDIDLDGLPEILACDDTGRRLIVFEHDGTFKWRSPFLESINWGAPAIADLDQDGTPEIVIGRQVLDNTGAILWTGAGGRGSQGNVGPLAGVADVTGDGVPEVIAGNTVYQANGSILWSVNIADGLIGVGNFDADALPEIVLVSGGQVYLLEGSDGTILWGPVAIPAGGAGGPPTIADYDNDGLPEIGVAGASRYAVFDTDGTLIWAAPTQDLSSNRTGSSVFDFEGDGSAEVVYSDELTLRIYRGTDGFVLFSVPLSSCTWHEYPLVADVDADGNAEIVAVANNNCGKGPQRGIRVYGDANDNWVATRRLWNQHTYHITNVNDDGTIPVVENDNWQFPAADPYNNYRQNVLTQDLPATAAPDLTASLIECAANDLESYVTVRVGNAGAVAVGAGLPVSFYDGDPGAGGLLLGTTTTTVNLEPGEFEDVALAVGPGFDFSLEIHAVADDSGGLDGTQNECDETNNRHFFAGCEPTAALAVDKTPDPPEIIGPEGLVTYTVTITNTWAVEITIDSVFDDRFGDVGASCDQALPATLAPGEVLTCTFAELVSGSDSEPHVNVVTASGLDRNDVPVEGNDAATVTFIVCIDPDPVTQGYWHRQCLGVPASEGGIDPGRNGRGPQSPTEPGFVEELMPCAEERLEQLGFYGETTCEGMDADPANDPCERALKQLTALILNVCSGRLSDGCEVDTGAEGCSSTTVGDLIDELAGLIQGGTCQQAADCAGAVNEGDALVGDGGGEVPETVGTRPDPPATLEPAPGDERPRDPARRKRGARRR